MSLLEVKNLEVKYITDLETVHAVNHVSFAVDRGETLGLVGETGAGKTTMALSILRLLPEFVGQITDGEILFDGEDVRKKNKRELQSLRAKDISMIFQDPMTSLNPVMRIGNQIAEAADWHASKQLSKAEKAEIVDTMLRQVGIPPERKNDYPHQFSGGMKQRVVIAIALVSKPQLLIADEPTTALDVTIQAQVLHLMRKLKREMGMAMIMITHDLGIVALTCDKVGVVYAGEIVEYASCRDLFAATRKHPYTEGLFNSIPTISGDSDRLQPIQGQMPDPSNLPDGCKFHPRCPYCTEKCRTEVPTYTDVGGGHLILCHRIGGELDV